MCGEKLAEGDMCVTCFGKAYYSLSNMKKKSPGVWKRPDCISLLGSVTKKLLGFLNSLFSHSAGSCKSEIKVSAGLVSPKASPWCANGCLFSVDNYSL